MLAKGRARLALVAGLLGVFVLLIVVHSGPALGLSLPYVRQAWSGVGRQQRPGVEAVQTNQQALPEKTSPGPAPVAPHLDVAVPVASTHHEIFSHSTPDKRYFLIRFGDHKTINPSIIPHPTQTEVWIIVAQKWHEDNGAAVFFRELSCNARFERGVLSCIESPMSLPVPASFSSRCTGTLEVYSVHIGPRDARVFYGPAAPYAVWGSQSAHTCLGQWTQDFRMLTNWETTSYREIDQGFFGRATELQRAPSHGSLGPLQKNWFLFWDAKGEVHAHYDIAPQRSFAKVELDGSTKEDLAPFARVSDDVCMRKLMPDISANARAPGQATNYESIHQATNSLSITLCKRKDPACQKSEANTFVMTIFHQKKYYDFHGVYEPYVMLFKQTAPFEVYGISSKPIWIHGRGKPDAAGQPAGLPTPIPEAANQDVMIYVASMSWRSHEQKYHGYLDDTMFLAFGIEDTLSAGIDVLAGDILAGLALCIDTGAEVPGAVVPASLNGAAHLSEDGLP